METITNGQHSDLLALLLKTYSVKTESNPAFSMRAFSKKIGISSGALSEILQNKRRVTKQTAKKILSNLFFSPHEIESFFETTKNTSDSQEKSAREYRDLSIDQYAVLSNWQYFAFLNLIELPSLDHSISHLAKRLDLTPKKIREIIERLLKLEMIEEKEGRFIRTSVRYKTTEDITNSAIKKYHNETLELGQTALREVPVELRDFSSILLKINVKNIKKVKDLIRHFQDELSELVENDFPEEIYHMNVHLYPVTKNNNTHKIET